MTAEARKDLRARMEQILGIRKRLYAGMTVEPNPQEQAVEMLALIGEMTDDWNTEIAVETARLAASTEKLDESTARLDRRTRALTWMTAALVVVTLLLAAVHSWDLWEKGHQKGTIPEDRRHADLA